MSRPPQLSPAQIKRARGLLRHGVTLAWIRDWLAAEDGVVITTRDLDAVLWRSMGEAEARTS